LYKNNKINIIYSQGNDNRRDLEAQKIANGIQNESKTYVADCWRGQKTRQNAVTEMKAFVAGLKEDKPDIRRLLDEVAKKNMCTYYNMLLPEQVLDPRFFLNCIS